MDNGLIIRDALPEDAERLVEIYSHYVLNTAVSFEYTVPSVHDFTGTHPENKGEVSLAGL